LLALPGARGTVWPWESRMTLALGLWNLGVASWSAAISVVLPPFRTPFGGRNGAVTALHAYGTCMNDGSCSSATLGPSHAGAASTPDHGHTL
jgi:hypothetical protein